MNCLGNSDPDKGLLEAILQSEVCVEVNGKTSIGKPWTEELPRDKGLEAILQSKVCVEVNGKQIAVLPAALFSISPLEKPPAPSGNTPLPGILIVF